MLQPIRYRLAVLLLCAGSLVGAFPATSPLPTIAAPGAGIPAPLPNAVRPTIAINPNHGYIGQPVTVSGMSVASSAGVRVAWLYGDATVTVAIADRAADNSYSAATGVPADAEPGAAKVCAAVTGTVQAEFACADFIVDAPPPGSVEGQLPADALTSAAASPQAINATFRLLDQSGATVASAPIAADGKFSLPSVPPGSYQSAVIGKLTKLVQTGEVTVTPANKALVPVSHLKLVDCLLRSTLSYASADISFKRPIALGRVSSGNTLRIPVDPGYDFGTYVSGVPLNVTFGVGVQAQSDTTLQGVKYTISRGSKDYLTATATSPGPKGDWPVTLNMGQLPPGRLTLLAVPIENGFDGCIGVSRRVNVIADPMKQPGVQPGGATTWDAAPQRYHFSGTLPNVGGLLPLRYPDPPPRLPLLGTLENRLSAGVRAEGDMELDGTVRLRVMAAQASAKLLNVDLFNQSRNILPPGADRVAFDTKDLRQTKVPFGPIQLAHFNQDIPVFNSIVATFWGIVSVRVAISIGFNGDLVLQGTLKPLAPAFAATLTASIGSSLTITVAIELLLGVASAGGDAIGSVNLRVPMYIDNGYDPPVGVDDPSICIAANLRLWARVNYLFGSKSWNLGGYKLFDYPGGCQSNLSAATLRAAAQEVAPPRVLAAPNVAAGPQGQSLSVYVADTTPNQQVPTMQIMARFLDPQTGQWGAATPLTNGAHAVMDPVAAFYGGDGQALVAWTENTMSLAEDEAAGNDLNAILRRQEIFYATWNGQSWSAPQQLTNDMLPDGKAALAGDETGATLAWTTDTDGDITTRSDSRISVRNREFTDGGEAWGPASVLGEGMNAQVSIARRSGLRSFGTRVLAWTSDADGDIGTNGDRRVAMAYWNANTGAWTALDTSALPTGAESPSVALTGGSNGTVISPVQVRVAFLQRGKDGDGSSDTGIGNRAIIIVSGRNADGAWSIDQLRDGDQPVYAEQPHLAIGAGGESVLLFRRFGAPGTNGQLGQIALATQAPGVQRFSAPLYLTDEARQNWQPSLTINSLTNQALILKVGRAASGPAGASSLRLATTGAAHPTLMAQALATGDDAVESLTLGNTPDPALDPALSLSQQHAAPGSTVTISATVRNVGRAPATGLTVNFFSGIPGNGTFLGTANVGDLNFNESQVTRFDVSATGGAQPIYAEVVSGNGETSPDNNIATASLGALPAPTLMSVDISTRYEEGIELNWMPPDAQAVTGYRILRSETTGGPYELVGEATGTTYTDLLLQRGKLYYYVIQAFDAGGALSDNSAEMSGILPLNAVYLPAIIR